MRRPTFRASLLLPLTAALLACDDAAAPRGPGAILVHASTVLAEPFLYFQYSVSIDGGTPRTGFAGQDLFFVATGLAQGKHVVELTGTPSTCSAGTHSRDVSLRGGDTASVVFQIACSRTTGDLNVSVATTGPDPDPNGYRLVIDGLAALSLPSNGTTSFQFLPPGQYTLALSDVATNCSPPPSQSVTITAGAVSSVSFAVTCSPIAVVKFVASATGDDVDVDGYALQVGAGAARRGVANGVTLVHASAGTFDYAISDVQPNCVLSSPASGSLTVAAGDTATVQVVATCAAIGFGTLGTSASDPVADTLPASAGAAAAHDLVNVSVRYVEHFAIVVLRFGAAVTPAMSGAASALAGWVEIDTDESTATGSTPASNGFGASATMGVDYVLYLFESDTTSTTLLRLDGLAIVDSARVPSRFQGDSVILQVPLAKLGGDDGRFTFVQVVGTPNRPTDIAPNAGQIAARPAGSIVVNPGSVRDPAPVSRDGRSWSRTGGWRPPAR